MLAEPDRRVLMAGPSVDALVSRYVLNILRAKRYGPVWPLFAFASSTIQ